MKLSEGNSSLQPITWDSTARCHVVPYSFHFVVGVVVALLAILAICGNILVLCTYGRYASLRTSSNLFVINLTVADMFMSSIDFPILSAMSFNGCWMLGLTGCQIYGVSSAISSLVSINTLAMISFDRYIVVVHRLSPLHRLAKSTTGTIIVTIWILSIIWSVLPLTGIGSYRLEGMGTSCTFNYVDRRPPHLWYFLTLVAFNFFIPLGLIIFSYWRILISIRQIKKELKTLQGGCSITLLHRVETQAEIKTAITALFIIGTFCLAWTPYVAVAFLGLFGPEGVITPLISMFPNLLAKISTAANPILYSIGHPEVRKKMRKLLFVSHREPSWRPTSATVAHHSPAQSQICLSTHL
ncbi:rhodopsin, GQ-coupled-like [Biomphalaria glabrata]|uniref:Rhodopsin, GQ-coupled-like n=1 Tax=Biomphalaria glabrata TaxID=6526 RepID=A0A9W2ZMB4_BIOGL|nr:rhodopsin, GQ-coupled-like [Biomphalaria glabrata]